MTTTSTSIDDHKAWTSLVECKLRHLVRSFDRNPYIKMSHINPRCFNKRIGTENVAHNGQITQTGPYSLWFMGISFEKLSNLNIDLTEDIRAFIAAVHKHGVSNTFLTILINN